MKLGLQAVYNWLHRLGYTPLMPRPQHEDADEDVQEHFKAIVPGQIQAIAEAHPETETWVYFEDEARFGQQGTLTWVWARKGSRPRGVRQTQYQWLHLLTAVCPATGDALGLICQTLNRGVINVFLQQFCE